jgi:hypothetical protein
MSAANVFGEGAMQVQILVFSVLFFALAGARGSTAPASVAANELPPAEQVFGQPDCQADSESRVSVKLVFMRPELEDEYDPEDIVEPLCSYCPSCCVDWDQLGDHEAVFEPIP